MVARGAGAAFGQFPGALCLAQGAALQSHPSILTFIFGQSRRSHPISLLSVLALTSASLYSQLLSLGREANKEVQGSKELFRDYSTLCYMKEGGTSVQIIIGELQTQELELIKSVFVVYQGLKPEL